MYMPFITTRIVTGHVYEFVRGRQLLLYFYSASHSVSLSEALSTTKIDTVSEFTRRSATHNLSEGLAH